MKRTFAVGVLLLTVLGVGGFLLLSQPKKPMTLADYRKLHASQIPSQSWVEPSQSDAQKGIVPKRDVPAGMKEYRNEQYHFSILYPAELSVKESVDQYFVLTAVFESDNKDDPKGFEVYAMPYNLPQITEERFKKDLPSGVRTNVQDITIDGASGSAFYSKDQALGDTREVWFLRGGLLYEVTTLKPIEAWFKPILQTWQFI